MNVKLSFLTAKWWGNYEDARTWCNGGEEKVMLWGAS